MRRKADTNSAPDPPLPPTASQLLRFGVAPEDVRCWACGKDWDGTTPNGLPACVACRQLAGRALRLYLDLVFPPAADAAANEKRTEGTT